MLGLALHRLARPEPAEDAFKQALRLRPDYAEAHNNLANLYLDQNRLEPAEQAARAAIALLPGFAVAHYNLGLACLRLGRLDCALDSFQNALRLNPDYADAWFNLGGVQARLGNPAEAAAAYRHAVALKPAHAEAWYKLGNACLDQGRLDEALSACRKAVALRPDEYACTSLGHALFRLRRLDEALSAYRQALALKPELAALHANIGLVLACLGRNDESMHSFDTSLGLDPDSAGAHSARLYSMLYLPDLPSAESLAAHRRFAARCEAPLRPQWRAHANPRDPGRRLKVGYVSADFLWHSVAYFIEPVLARHDRAEVEIHCYHTSPGRDEVTDRIAAHADHWIACAGLDPGQLAGRIRADGIDILVDLAGHTSGNRLMAFARRPAPVQVTYLGYPATTGLDAMDYRLCTLDTDPPGQEAFHSEALYRLPRTLWCYRPFAERPAGDRATGQPGITFGSMNSYSKISPGTLDLWMEILHAVPGSRLVMTSVPEGSVRESIARRCAGHGIAPERVIMHDRLDYIDYWQLLRRIDIALDPFPYSGTTTTCETLWMGVPVVTLCGATSVARSSHALLKAVGIEDLAAADTEEYLRIAVTLARDPGRLARLHGELPRRFDASPLRDERGLARDLESAYRDMWRRWCARPETAA
ncbi:MAG: tetratricopeptide repeat protein [Gammaproteobacteria bacterium]|nr:tetratricopeptide repeat protein [Gammaproteobacteria bacterium]